jgi:CBS domain-containing protein
MTTASDVMTRDPIRIDANQFVAEAARLMAEHHIGMLPVMRGQRLVGVVTDRDLVLRVLAVGKDPAATTLANVASTWPVTVEPETPLDAVERVVEERRVRRIPVTTDGRLVGVVSQSDIARHAAYACPHLLARGGSGGETAR